MRNRFPVVGRDAELAVVDAALDGLAAGAGGAVEVVGDPGMGKTTLLRELWIRAGRRGVPVLRGHAQEDTAGIPFALIHEALVAPGDQLLRALVEPADRYPRYRRFRGLIEEQARPGGLVLALDDVHWADPASADLLAYLLRRPPAGPVLVVLARRERPVPVQLAASLEEAVRGGALRRLRLRPLRRAEAAPLLRGVAEAVRDRVYELSEGCPLYLEALCTLAAGGVSDPGPLLRDRQLPGPVAAVLLRDLAALGPLARLVAEAAAVVGDPVDADLVARVAPCPAEAVLDGFDELVARDILRCVDAAVWFRHPLVREATYWSSGAGWRMAAHARAVAALRERGQSPVRCAHHVERSVSGVDPRGAELLILAAQEVAATAPAIAARWYGAGLELCGGLPQDPSRRADLLIRRARMLGLAGQLREARDALRGLLATAALDGPARVELVASTAALQRLLGEHEPAVAMLRRELARTGRGRGAGRTGLLLELSCHHFLRREDAEQLRYARQAYQRSVEAGDRRHRATAATLLSLAECARARTAAATGLLTEAEELLGGATDAELAGLVETFVGLAMAATSLDRYTAAIRHAGRAIAICQRTGQGYTLSHLFTVLAEAQLCAGDLSAAAESADNAVHAAMMTDNDAARSLALNKQSEVALWSGEVPKALACAEQAAALAERHDDWPARIARGSLSLVWAVTGDPRGDLGDYVAAHGGDGLPVLSAAWRPRAYASLTEAALLAGDRAAAVAWARRAEAAALPLDLAGATGYALLASAMAAVPTCPEAAAVAARGAAAHFERAGARLAVARAVLTLGTALAGDGDGDAAQRAYGRAEALFHSCGAGALASLAGAHREPPAQPPPCTDRLSPRERQVARLIAEGCSNRQIARALEVSDKTVETHVSSILRKLGVLSRAAVAGIVARGGYAVVPAGRLDDRPAPGGHAVLDE